MKKMEQFVFMILVVLTSVAALSCSLSTGATDTAKTFTVEIGGVTGKAAGRAINSDTNVEWVRIRVETSLGALVTSATWNSKVGGVWRGPITVSVTGDLTFIITAGKTVALQDQVYYLKSAVKTIGTDTSSVTIPVILLAVGDTGPAGGKIFFRKDEYSDGWRYLEAAPEEQSESQAWSNVTNALIGATAQGSSIGLGQTNTTAIIGQAGHTSSAAKLCDDFSVEKWGVTYDDWFLPSIDELQVASDLIHFGPTLFSTYWSSTEDPTDGTTANAYSWEDPVVVYPEKGETLGVWAVRSF